MVHGHGVVGQVVGHLELLVQQLTNIRVQPVHQGVAVVLPAVVLPTPENRGFHGQPTQQGGVIVSGFMQTACACVSVSLNVKHVHIYVWVATYWCVHR